ncbi:MAG TPA: hypothetical protein VF179_04550 [Thermoanaerobaculia bacterium]|nr:hypothetical protein [Thermoanaerobaculia bacterium]
MSQNLSIAQMLAQLEARVAHHERQQALHSEQEALYRDKAAFHREQLEAARANLEAFRAASVAAGELLVRDRSVEAPAPTPAEDIDVRRRKSLSRMMARVIAELPPDAVFGARSLTSTIQRRWGAKLRRQPDPRSVATTLRRWAQDGRIAQVREGRAHNEGLYRKRPQQT